MRHNSKRQPQSQTLVLTKTSHWLAAAAAGNCITETFKSIKRTHGFTCTQQQRVVAQAQALAGLWHVILEDYDCTIGSLYTCTCCLSRRGQLLLGCHHAAQGPMHPDVAHAGA